MISCSHVQIFAMMLGLSTPSEALQTSVLATCKPWCKWPSQCGNTHCADCEMCEDTAKIPPHTTSVDCEDNCASKGVVTSSEAYDDSKCGVTKGGPYDPVTCPMKYLGWAPKTNFNAFCEGDGDGPWVEVDLGAVTRFNTIEVVQPQRKAPKYNPPGFCGLQIWVDDISEFQELHYSEGTKYDGPYQITSIHGEFTGQKVKVKYGRSAKNPTAHLFGINVYKK